MNICGSFWKWAATTTIGDILLDGVERLEQAGAHVEIELAGGEQDGVVGLWAALAISTSRPYFA